MTFMDYVEREKSVKVKEHRRRRPIRQPHKEPRGRSPMKGVKVKVLGATALVVTPIALLTQKVDPRITVVGLSFYALSLMTAWCWWWVRKWNA